MGFRSEPLLATYSIVARDPDTGEVGVAVQSNYFSVGTEAPWAEAGLGAVATQAIVEVAYGPRGLGLLRDGLTAGQTLERLLAADPGAALRQVAVVDAKGTVAAHTGALCVPCCGHATGDGYSVQGNMLASDEVWQAMGPAFERAQGDLAARLLAALDAAEQAGGDLRGRQSAALLVRAGERTAKPWEARVFDLQVQDHPRPLDELRRLCTIRRAYLLFDEARDAIGAGDIDAALALIGRALALKPGDPQFCFWTGLGLANAGRDDEARAYFAQCFAAGEGWRELARRLQKMGLYRGASALLET